MGKVNISAELLNCEMNFVLVYCRRFHPPGQIQCSSHQCDVIDLLLFNFAQQNPDLKTCLHNLRSDNVSILFSINENITLIIYLSYLDFRNGNWYRFKFS